MKSLPQRFHCLKTPSGRELQRHLSNGINIVAGDDPVPVKFGTHPQQEGCAVGVSRPSR